MKILAIDSATTVMGVSVTENGKVLSEYTTNLKLNHSVRLMPAVQHVLNEVGIQPSELDRIAVTKGPGSYTGVRIGVTIAKTLAWSLKKELVGISTLACMAQNGHSFSGIIAPFFDARRERVYSGLYKINPESSCVEALVEDQIRSVEEWLEELSNQMTPILFVSQDLHLFKDKIEDKLGQQAHFAPQTICYPRPSELAALALNESPVESIHHFIPEYLQMAEAEAKWQANQKSLK